MIISLSRETCRVYSDRKNSRSKRESKHEFPEEPRGIRVRGTKKVRRKGKLSKKGNQLEVVVFVPHSSFEYLRGPIDPRVASGRVSSGLFRLLSFLRFTLVWKLPRAVVSRLSQCFSSRSFLCNYPDAHRKCTITKLDPSVFRVPPWPPIKLRFVSIFAMILK